MRFNCWWFFGFSFFVLCQDPQFLSHWGEKKKKTLTKINSSFPKNLILCVPLFRSKILQSEHNTDRTNHPKSFQLFKLETPCGWKVFSKEICAQTNFLKTPETFCFSSLMSGECCCWFTAARCKKRTTTVFLLIKLPARKHLDPPIKYFILNILFHVYRIR